MSAHTQQTANANQYIDTNQPKVVPRKILGVMERETVEVQHPTNPERTVHIPRDDYDADPSAYKLIGKLPKRKGGALRHVSLEKNDETQEEAEAPASKPVLKQRSQKRE